MTILSLDQSTSAVGFCLFRNREYLVSGVFIPEGDNIDERYRSVYKFVKHMIELNEVEIVTLEDIWLNERVDKKDNPFKQQYKSFGDNVNVHKVLGELLGACKMACLTNENVNRIKVIHPNSWKSAFKMSGKGWNRDRQKLKAIQFAEKISGKKIETNDEGDAVCMAYYANKELFNMNEELRKGEFKIEGYPHVFKYFEAKDFKALGAHHGFFIVKEVKEIVGQSSNGKNKWSKTEKAVPVAELKTLNKAEKLNILQQLKEKGFKNDLARLVFEEQLKYLEEGK